MKPFAVTLEDAAWRRAQASWRRAQARPAIDAEAMEAPPRAPFVPGPAWRERHPTPSADVDAIGRQLAAQARGCPHRLATLLDAVTEATNNAFRRAGDRDRVDQIRRNGL